MQSKGQSGFAPLDMPQAALKISTDDKQLVLTALLW